MYNFNIPQEIKIVDAFTFYNELDMLELRLAELNEVVDYFVLVEATETHVGHPKELYFENNKARYAKYLHKIIHVKVDKFPETSDAWVREKFQRNSIQRGLNSLDLSNLDIITITDCDEIPDSSTLLNIKHSNFNGVLSLEQTPFYYNFNCAFKTKWYHPKVCTYNTLLRLGGPEKVRFASCNSISNGGWHLSYFGSTDFISNKIKNFAHQEFNNDKYNTIDAIKTAISNNKSLFSDDYGEAISTNDNNYLPNNWKLIDNFLEFKNL